MVRRAGERNVARRTRPRRRTALERLEEALEDLCAHPPGDPLHRSVYMEYETVVVAVDRAGLHHPLVEEYLANRRALQDWETLRATKRGRERSAGRPIRAIRRGYNEMDQNRRWLAAVHRSWRRGMRTRADVQRDLTRRGE